MARLMMARGAQQRGTDMLNIAERNRAIKKVLSAKYGRDAVTVRGSRGTGYGYVHVNIDATPLDWRQRSDMVAECKELLRAAGLDLGRSYTDDTCQHTTDRCSIDFNHTRYRQTVVYSNGSRAGLRWDDDQWEPVAAVEG
jgi:hypothetical protein